MVLPYYLQGIEFLLEHLHPKYFHPKKQVFSVADINTEDLKNRGIQGIIFDVDNTLCGYRGTEVDEEVRNNFLKMKEMFRTCIISNTDEKRMRELEEHFKIPVIQSEFKKPRAEPYLKAMEYLGTTPKQTAMIGDRFLTDIVGANKLGIYSIRTRPLNPGSSPLAIKAVRAFEEFWYY